MSDGIYHGGVDRWSRGKMWTVAGPTGVRVYLEVQDFGVLVLACSDGHEDGRIRPEGAADFSKELIYFDREGDAHG